MSTIQHLLEKQREEFEKRFNLNVVCKECDPDLSLTQGAIKDFLSTIQREILQATREKIEEIFKNADEREDRVELSDITSWLEGDIKKQRDEKI